MLLVTIGLAMRRSTPLVVAICCSLQPAEAQTSRTARASTRLRSDTFPVFEATSRVSPRARRIDGSKSTIVMSAVRTTVENDGVVVVRVPVPDTLRELVGRNVTLDYSVRTNGSTRVVGAAKGSVVTEGSRAILLALQPGRRQAAGVATLAEVDIETPIHTVTIPIEASIPAKRDVAIDASATNVFTRPGQWAALSVRIVNRGNVAARTRITMSAPKGWNYDIPDGAHGIVVSASDAREVPIRVRPTSDALPGSYVLTLVTLDDGGVQESRTITVTVRGELNSSGIGPRLTTSFASSSLVGGPSAIGYALKIDGPLSAGVNVFAQASFSDASSTNSAASFGLGRASALTAPPVVALESQSLSARFGAVGLELPSLGGTYANGLGGTLSANIGMWSIAASDLRPVPMMQRSVWGTAAGRLSNVSVIRASSALKLGAYASSLSEPLTRRELSSVGVTASKNLSSNSEWRFDGAWREYADGRGLGVSSGFRTASEAGSVDLRASHAPGGMRAFARATDDVTLSASRRLGSIGRVQLSGWMQSDMIPQSGSLANRGLTALLSRQIGDRGPTLGLDARHMEFRTTGGSAKVTNSEDAIGPFLDAVVWGWQLQARSVAGMQSRLLSVELSESRSATPRLENRVQLVRSLALGSFSASWSAQRYLTHSSPFSSQEQLSFRVDGVRPFQSLPVQFEGEALRLSSIGPAPWALRSAISVQLPGAMRVAITVDRQPFFAGLVPGRGNRVPLLYGLRLDRASRLPRVVGVTQRRIYRDDNGNGHFDKNESGVSGVNIRCGNEQITTDSNGAFRCPESVVDVDASSVPVGLLPPRLAAMSQQDIGLRTMQPVLVQLHVSANDSVRLPIDVVAKALVAARDSRGLLWYARNVGDGRFAFESMPAGHYGLVFDAGDSDEPIRAEALPEFDVSGDKSVPMIRVQVAPRALRIRTFGPNQASPDRQPAAGHSSPSRSPNSKSSSLQ